MNNTEFDFDAIVGFVSSHVNFSFSRFGDGEINCILGKKGQNCDGHEYFPEMGKELKRIITTDKPANYYLGLQAMVQRLRGEEPEFKEIIAHNQNKFVKNDILHYASMDGKIADFFKVCFSRHVIMVGNEKLIDLGIANKFIEIPVKNCWNSYAETLQALRETVEPNNVILYCASMMSNVLIDAVFDEFGPDYVTQIDCGSVFDPYVGIQSRSYHKDPKHAEKFKLPE